MHIGMILGTKRGFPPDIRVEKEINALVRAGHRISLLVKKVQKDSPYRETFTPGADIIRSDVNGMNYIQRVFNAMSVFDLSWFPHVCRFIKEEKPDILHVHDFPMVPTVLKAAGKSNIPVIADLHENMPAAFVARRSAYPLKRKVRDMIRRNYYLWRWHESRSLKRCKKVVVVVPEAAERLQEYGISG